MKTVYMIWNYDCDEPILTTEDKSLAYELIYDYYIEDAYYQFYWETIGPYSKEYDNYIDEVISVKKDISNWYKDWIDIIPLPITE